MSLRFEWDEAKNRSNQRKHGVSFQEAAAVFRDPNYISVQDRIVDGEARWQTLGLVRETVLLLVAHTIEDENTHDLVVRIMSARSANRRERLLYESANR